jgi:hypothetical protein
MVVEINCDDVWREVSNYVDGETDAPLRLRMEHHFESCKRCRAVLYGTRNVVRLLGDGEAFELPANLSKRLYSKLDQYHAEGAESEKMSRRDMALGITSERVPLGSHLLYFWENDEDFERGVSFLYPGLGRREHCVVFGHDEALEKVLHVLRSKGFDPERLLQNREMTVLRRHASAQVTLSDFRDVMEAAVHAGATGIRWLGNLGMGRDRLPAGENDLVDLEQQASDLISQFPCVIVCMYDVGTLPGRLILKGGLQQHRLSVCSEGVHENPYYVPEQDSANLRRIQ